MKNSILLLIALVSISITQRVLAQSNAQVTTEDLKNFYKNKEYKKAISYIEQFENSKDDIALIILGDCCLKKSVINEKQAIKSRNQMMINQSMAMSQGLYLDNSLVLNLQHQIEQRTVQLKLQAVDLYSKAAQLGNDVGTQRIALLNSTGKNATSINIPSNVGYSTNPTPPTSTSGSSNLKLLRETCTSCSGTGVSRTATSVPGFGSTAQHWCDDCKSMVSASHGAHLQCPICGGKKYVERYR